MINTFLVLEKNIELNGKPAHLLFLAKNMDDNNIEVYLKSPFNECVLFEIIERNTEYDNYQQFLDEVNKYMESVEYVLDIYNKAHADIN